VVRFLAVAQDDNFLVVKRLSCSAEVKNPWSYTSIPPITVAVNAKARNIFTRSNAAIVGSNSAWSVNVYVRLFCVCALLCASIGLATG
jgi:hypothetical protein